jgi:hypothetical protein
MREEDRQARPAEAAEGPEEQTAGPEEQAAALEARHRSDRA